MQTPKLYKNEVLRKSAMWVSGKDYGFFIFGVACAAMAPFDSYRATHIVGAIFTAMCGFGVFWSWFQCEKARNIETAAANQGTSFCVVLAMVFAALLTLIQGWAPYDPLTVYVITTLVDCVVVKLPLFGTFWRLVQNPTAIDWELDENHKPWSACEYICAFQRPPQGCCFGYCCPP
ncbi:Hypothetical protein POVN_LOCUS643 [uncultured virus]|nr:Hypothetical protein POVN_LOCUS643 [uncultured virus]